MVEDESGSSKREEEFFGIPISKLGAPALAIGALGLIAGIASFFKPQIDQKMMEMQNKQAYAQQAQLAQAQEQQRQLVMQHQHQQDLANQAQQESLAQQDQQPPQEVNRDYAVEQDPFNRQRPKRVAIPEYEASSEQPGVNRFNNISV